MLEKEEKGKLIPVNNRLAKVVHLFTSSQEAHLYG
jgi:hypothetical protein